MIKNTSIKIGVKVKPCPKESIIKTTSEGNTHSVYINSSYESKKFQVDALHDANISSSTMFEDLRIHQLVSKFIQGFNVTIMAYGQTGAGKTYCMEGNNNENGIILDSINRIYEKVSPDASLSCSYLQIYNQKIYDLLVEQANTQSLRMRWESERDFIVQDLSVHEAKTSKDMEKSWKKGTKNRIVASNKIHDLSSRSHALFFITLSDRDQFGTFRYRQLAFIDLAGSERILDNLGKLTKQSIQINKSLFVLRKVIKILEQASVYKKQLYVPYRDSKLTSLLKKALGGNCLTMMIACIDSSPEQKEETLLTLSYAISTGRIQNSAHVNIDQQALENKRLKIENEKLKKQLETAWKQIDILHRKQKIEAERKSMSEFSHKIIECIGTIRELIKSNKELREELEQERKVKNQQKLEIQMLMEERYMLKKYNSLQAPSPTRFYLASHQNQRNPHNSPQKDTKSLGDFNPSFIQLPSHVAQKQEVSPHRIIRIREVPNTNSTSPTKGLSRKDNSSVHKRKTYTFHKTEPDELVELRSKTEKKEDKLYQRVTKP